MSESKSEQCGREKERVRKNALLLFSKLPIPGLVKTRLTVLKDGVFQPEVASGLYHCMLFDVVEICCAAMADLERESAERAQAALAAGEEAVRDEYEMIISTTPEKNVEVMRKLFSDAGQWPRELVFLCDEGASFDEHYNQAFEKTWARGADCILSMGADMPALTKADVRAGFNALHKLDGVAGGGIVLAPDQEMGVSDRLDARDRLRPLGRVLQPRGPHGASRLYRQGAKAGAPCALSAAYSRRGHDGRPHA